MGKERRVTGQYFDLLSYPGAIRVDREKLKKDGYSEIGIITLIPNIEVILGLELEEFICALEFSRIPLAIKLSLSNSKLEYYSIIRLATGKVMEAKIADLCVYKGKIIGVSYNRAILDTKEFRKYVALSVLHQLTIYDDGKASKLLQATKYVSIITGIPRDKLVVVETKKSMLVRVAYKNPYNIPLYYTFTNYKGVYKLSQMGFHPQDINKI